MRTCPRRGPAFRFTPDPCCTVEVLTYLQSVSSEQFVLYLPAKCGYSAEVI